MATKSILRYQLICVAAIILGMNARINIAKEVIQNNKLVLLCETLQPCIGNKNTTVSINYFYSDLNGNGNEFPLRNGFNLYHGDRFTIKITAHKSTYLYLIYVDSSGSIQELLQESESFNYLHAGKSLTLPNSDVLSVFELDANPGTETIYAIVSAHKRQDIERMSDSKNWNNLILTCECGDPCLEPFIINHLQ
jgi:hypothetical protein